MPKDSRTEDDGYPYDDEDDEGCWRCHGAGGWHDCGEDCCVCLDKDEITVICPVCHGRSAL